MKIKKILIKKPNIQTINGRKRTIHKQELHNIKSLNQDFSTKFGNIKKEDLAKTGRINLKNQEYFSFNASIIDQLKNIRRTSQMIPS